MNLDPGHIAVILAAWLCAAPLFAGGTLYRFMAIAAVWQIFSPTRPILLDVPLFLAFWLLSEFAYERLSVKGKAGK